MTYQTRAVLIKQGDSHKRHDLVIDVSGLANTGYRLPQPPTLVVVGRIVALCSFTEAEGLDEILEWFAAAQRAYGKKRLNHFILGGVALSRPRKGWKRRGLSELPRPE